MLAWIPIAAVLAQAPAGQAANPEDVPPEVRQLQDEVQALRQQVDAQRQQLDQLTQTQDAQQESVTGLQDYQNNQVQQLQQREDDRSGRVELLNQAVASIQALADDIQRGSADIDVSLNEALARVDVASQNAQAWGMQREAELLVSSRTQLAALPALVARRDFWEAKIATHAALSQATSAVLLMQGATAPPQP
jgi:hypothetical protein